MEENANNREAGSERRALSVRSNEGDGCEWIPEAKRRVLGRSEVRVSRVYYVPSFWRCTYWGFAPLFRFLAKYEAERDKTSTFVDSKITMHLFVQKLTTLAVAVVDIFTKASRPSRENWVHIQHYFQGDPPRPSTFF